MTRLLFVAAALFIGLPFSRAEVLIYAGTIQRTEPEDSYKPYPLKCFIVTNPMTGEISILGYGKVNGIKRRSEGPVTTADYYPLNRPDGSFFDFYAYALTDKSVGIFYRSIFLRGAQKTVNVNRISGNLLTAQRARVLKGSVRDFGGGFGYEYAEVTIVATLDETRTVDSNVATKTIAVVREELASYLDSLGFSL